MDVIGGFRGFLSKYEPQFTKVRAGFMARPFGAEFDAVESYFTKYLEDHAIKMQCYSHPPGAGALLAKMLDQIRDCHFGIVDLTGLNLNVVNELGMLTILEKPCLALRRHDDEGELPTNLSSLYCYSYKVDSEARLSVLNFATGKFENTDKMLKQFVENLKRDAQFRDAQEWRS